MSFWREFGKNILGDVRNTIVNAMLTAGFLSFGSAILAAIVKTFKAEPIPWTILIVLSAVGVALLIIALRVRRAPEVAEGKLTGGSTTLARIAEAHVPKPVRIVNLPRQEDNYLRDTIRKRIEEGEQQEEERQRTRRAVLENAVEYIAKVKAEEEEARLRYPGINRMPRRLDMLDVIMRAGAHKLDRESDVIWLCDKLVSGGHKHPFEIFEREFSPVLKGEWVEFIEAFWVGGWASKIDVSAWSFAVTIWKHKDRWLKRPNRPFAEEQSRILVSCGRHAGMSVISATDGRTYFRAKLELDGSEAVHNLNAAITAIRRDGQPLPLNEAVRLMFHPGVSSLEELREGIPGVSRRSKNRTRRQTGFGADRNLSRCG
jgi:hypothetical protein